MCFSAAASFIASTVLIPAGMYSMNRSFQGNKNYLALAAFPLFFGIQQLFEGSLWLALGGDSDLSVGVMSKGFLFFAYFFWPFYVPLSVYFIEQREIRKKIFFYLSIVGFIFGASLYIPLLINPEWMSLSLVNKSILYDPVLIYDGLVPRMAVRVFYAAIIAVSLLLSSIHTVRIFGLMISISVIGTTLFFTYAFVSVWCFFAAILSAYIVYIMRHELVHTKQT